MTRLKQAWLALFARKPKPPATKDPQKELSARLRAWRPIGGTFKYLGRTMVVTAHGRWEFIGYGSQWYAGLHADYEDNNGVIHNARFDMLESLALMAAQPKPKVAKGKRRNG